MPTVPSDPVVFAIPNRVVGGGGAPPVVVTYLNRWWDSIAVAMVRYTTTGAPDPTGASYPGPGVPGVTATSYCLEGSW